MATPRGPIYQEYARPPSAPPPNASTFRPFSPTPSPLSSTPSSPRVESDWQQKEKDRLAWQARWKAYEEKKASWGQAQWSEYEKRKNAELAPRREVEELKTERSGIATPLDRKTARSRGPLGEAGEWSSAPSSRSSSVDSRKGAAPLAPTPIRTGAFNYTNPGSQSSRSTTPATPPPRYRASPQPFTQIRPEPASPIRSTGLPPNYQAFTAPARRMASPAPSSPSTPTCPSPLSPNLFTSRPVVQTPSNPILQNRARSYTNPTSPRPTIFVPKASTLSDGDASRRTESLGADERYRRAVDEQRRMQQAAEHAARRNAEAAEKARFEATTPKKAGASRTEPPRHHHQRASSQNQRLIHGAWEMYEDRWKAMNDGHFPLPGQLLSFTDIPWPIAGPIHSVEQLEDGRLGGFLLSNVPSGLDQAKLLKQRIRDTMLRFHPDRFEGRWIPHVVEADRAAVKEGVGRVVRFLNEISGKLA